MVKFISFVKMTEKGQLIPPDKAPAVLAKVLEITRAYGGKIESMYATSGRFDFVSIAEFPDELTGFKARTKILELGLYHMESAVIFPVETYIEAVQEEKVLATV